MSSLEEQLKRALEKIQKDVQKSLECEVAELVVDKEVEHIITDVYDNYEPSKYKRRKENNGLIDENNIAVIPTENGIKVINLTLPNMDNKSNLTIDDNLSDLIEMGNEYNGLEYYYTTDFDYLEPRPFQHNTVEELEQTGEHIEVLKNALKNKGYKVK